MDSDHYAVLGLPSGEEGARISDKEIAKAYRRKALELHPDKRPDDPNAKIYFQKLKASYDILKDEKARKQYDDLLLARAAEICAKHKRKQEEELASMYAKRHAVATLHMPMPWTSMRRAAERQKMAQDLMLQNMLQNLRRAVEWQNMVQKLMRAAEWQNMVNQQHMRGAAECQNMVNQQHMRAAEWQNMVNQQHMRAAEWQNMVNQQHMRAAEWQNMVNQQHMRAAEWQNMVNQQHMRAAEWQNMVQQQHVFHI
ncbi:PREDICTED: flagellar attachment zone protein 1-like [Ipomoea nil]|uniref:flagellar attachment zone protein 1-like n=1 Tax=Ipomoea nil TaxID=35883 RepID=UPI00090149CC|nr:PREDICTED: flagellar attachment zone protein 1-like [Ipomoea nil]